MQKDLFYSETSCKARVFYSKCFKVTIPPSRAFFSFKVTKVYFVSLIASTLLYTYIEQKVRAEISWKFYVYICRGCMMGELSHRGSRHLNVIATTRNKNFRKEILNKRKIFPVSYERETTTTTMTILFSGWMAGAAEKKNLISFARKVAFSSKILIAIQIFSKLWKNCKYKLPLWIFFSTTSLYSFVLIKSNVPIYEAKTIRAILIKEKKFFAYQSQLREWVKTSVQFQTFWLNTHAYIILSRGRIYNSSLIRGAFNLIRKWFCGFRDRMRLP